MMKNNTCSPWLVFFCQFVVILALEMANPFLPSFVQSLSQGTLSETAHLSAWVLASPMIAMIITSPLWGRLGDRYGYKKMLLRACVGLVICQALTAACSSAWQLVAIRFLQGGFAGFISAMQAYALHTAAGNQKARILGRLQSAKAMGTSFGGLLGGGLLLWTGFHRLYLISSITCLAILFIIYFALPDDSTHTRTNDTPPKENKPPVLFGLGFLLLLVSLAQLAKFIPGSIFSIYAETMLHASPWMVGLLYSAPGFSILLSAEISGRCFDNLRKNPVNKRAMTFFYLSSVTLFAAILMILHGVSQNFTVLLGVRLGWGIVLGTLLPAIYTVISEQGQGRQQGYYIGVANSFAKLGNLSGLFLGAWLVGLITLSHVFLAIALVYLAMSMLSLAASMEIDSNKIRTKLSQWKIINHA